MSAPEELVGATVFVDTTAVARLGYMRTHGTFFGWVMKKVYGDSPLDHIVTVNVDLSNSGLSAGAHGLRVEKQGGAPALGTFKWLGPGTHEFLFFYVNGSKIQQEQNVTGNS